MSRTRRERIEEMLRDNPGDHELRYMLGMEHASAGDDAGAVCVFLELIRLNPEYPPAYHMGARALQRLDRLREARELLHQGIPVAMRLGDHHAAGEMQELLSLFDA